MGIYEDLNTEEIKIKRQEVLESKLHDTDLVLDALAADAWTDIDYQAKALKEALRQQDWCELGRLIGEPAIEFLIGEES